MRGRFLWASTAILLAGCTAYKPVDDGSQVPWANSLVSLRASEAEGSYAVGHAEPVVRTASVERQFGGQPSQSQVRPAGAPMRVTPLTSGTPLVSRSAAPVPSPAVQPVTVASTQPTAPVAAAQPTNSAAAPATTHTVAKGDWLLGVAREYEVDPKALAAANDLQSPYELRPGQVLKIPAGGTYPVAATTPDSNAQSKAVAAAKPAAASSPDTYVVQRGDGLYGIAREHDVTVQQLANANSLEPNAQLVTGQKLQIPAPGTSASGTAVAKAVPSTGSLTSGSEVFLWPVDGKVIAEFGDEKDGESRSGIAIQARKGTPVKASRDGVVVYAGDAIRGYGRMILLRHDDGYVTAYGHNSAILVNVGETVEQGQVIARVGDTGGVPSPQLHFEIRQGKQPIDPATVLAGSTTAAQSTT